MPARSRSAYTPRRSASKLAGAKDRKEKRTQPLLFCTLKLRAILCAGREQKPPVAGSGSSVEGSGDFLVGTSAFRFNRQQSGSAAGTAQTTRRGVRQGNGDFFPQPEKKRMAYGCLDEGDWGMIRERGEEIEPACREESAGQSAARTISSRQQMDRATIETYEKKRRGKRAGIHKTVAFPADVSDGNVLVYCVYCIDLIE